MGKIKIEERGLKKMRALEDIFRKIQQERTNAQQENREHNQKDIPKEGREYCVDPSEHTKSPCALTGKATTLGLEEQYHQSIKLASVHEPDHWEIARTHLFLAGNIAERLGAANNQYNIQWMLASHEARRKAHDLAFVHGRERGGYYALRFAGNSSQHLFEIVNDVTERLRWGEICFEERMTSGEKAEQANNPRFAGYVLSFAGNIAEKISNLVEDKKAKASWLKKSYEARIRASKDSETDGNMLHASCTYAFASYVAKNVARLAESNEEKQAWYKKSYEASKKAIKLNKGADQKFLAHAHGAIGDAAFHLSELADNSDERIRYLTEDYDHRIESEKFASSSSTRCAESALEHANMAARILGETHPDSQQRVAWQNRFKEGVRVFRERYMRSSQDNHHQTQQAITETDQ